MKSRDIYYPRRQVTSSTNKSTGVTTTSVNSFPYASENKLAVLANSPYQKDVMKNHHFRKDLHQDYLGNQIIDSSGSFIQISGHLSSFVNYVPGNPDYTSIYNQAISDFYDKLRSGEVGSGLNLAVDIAEAHQVAKMLGQATKLVTYIRGFRNPKNWGDKWLEYQYGWKPLASSLYGTFAAIMHRKSYSYQRITGEGYERNITTNKYTTWIPWPGVTEYVGRDRKRGTKIVCEYRMMNTPRQQLMGYTSLNPLVITWELVPYSFVVDWFYNIGGYMQSMEAAFAFGQGFVRGYFVNREKDYHEAYLSGAGTSGSQFRQYDGKASHMYCEKSRTIIGSPPWPMKPTFQCDLGSQRLISAASLLKQFMRR